MTTDRHIPGRITATPTGLDVEAQTVIFSGVAYEIPAQSLDVSATNPAHFRLILTADGLALNETPLGEEPEPVEGEVCTLASFDLQPGQPVTEAACWNVSRREGTPPPPERTVKTGQAQRRGPSPAQVARRQRRRDMESIRAKLAEGRALTPQEMSEALRAVMERVG